MLSDVDRELFSRGVNWKIFNHFGAHIKNDDGPVYTEFLVWAPHAKKVSVVGDFNNWDLNSAPLAHINDIWHCKWPASLENQRYRFALEDTLGNIHYRIDPYSRKLSQPPDNCSIVCPPSQYCWEDDEWMAHRESFQNKEAPLSIYEVHLASWKLLNGHLMNYRTVADTLIAYVVDLGFTHIELLPILEHPFIGSWGYQPLGLFAPSSRLGTADDLRYLIDTAHQHGLGVLLDWVPAHFPNDLWGLASFDGQPLYEYADPREGVHPHWDSLIYNYKSPQVTNFLISSAVYWANAFHIDGFRVDAVASMLYKDYGRMNGNFIRNVFGGNENLEAIDFLKTFNDVIHREAPSGLITIAEDSTSWPLVTKPCDAGGLGFDFKWNMGWMNDTLSYFGNDVESRSHQHHHLTFGITYAWSENFILPLSHDEVVHCKSSLLNKMPGDRVDQQAQLRLLLALQYTMPGKKLLFMGTELGMEQEWSHDGELQWALAEISAHQNISTLIRDLNTLYRNNQSLIAGDTDPEGFEWLSCDDNLRSVIAFKRHSIKDQSHYLMVFNFTPVPRSNYLVGVAHPGTYEEVIHTQSSFYGGKDPDIAASLSISPTPYGDFPYSLKVSIPGLCALIYRHV